MNILISNDDGIDAPGLKPLVQAFAATGDTVFVCAPKNEQSGMAHAMTVHRPMELIQRDDFAALGAKVAYAVDGTPTDCVKSFLEFLSEEKIDATISGINFGANLGTDVLYSGTVGAALEGFLHEMNALAFSIERDTEIYFAAAAKIAVDFARRQIIKHKNSPRLLNVNFPAKFYRDTPQFVPTLLGRRDYINAFSVAEDGAGRKFMSIKGEIFDSAVGKFTDIYAVKKGLVAVTQLNIDVADSRLFLDEDFGGE